MKTYVAHSPKLINWNKTHGGPVYLSVGQHLVLNVTNYTVALDDASAVTVNGTNGT